MTKVLVRGHASVVTPKVAGLDLLAQVLGDLEPNRIRHRPILSQTLQSAPTAGPGGLARTALAVLIDPIAQIVGSNCCVRSSVLSAWNCTKCWDGPNRWAGRSWPTKSGPWASRDRLDQPSTRRWRQPHTARKSPKGASRTPRASRWPG